MSQTAKRMPWHQGQFSVRMTTSPRYDTHTVRLHRMYMFHGTKDPTVLINMAAILHSIRALTTSEIGEDSIQTIYPSIMP